MVQIKALVASLLLSPVLAESMYGKSSPVLQVDQKSFDKLIAESNYTSIVEFYAPWCGHCKNLKPAYEKAAKSLAGLAQVAAINCDDEENKPLCGQMGVQGFPTLKLVRPGKKRAVIDLYEGARTAKAIVDAVVDKIPNHVKRVGDKDLDDFLKASETAKAILFSEKGTTSALLRVLASQFLGSVQFAQIRSKEEKAVGMFGIEKFPTLVLLPGGDKEALVYDGELKKDAMIAFISQVAAPTEATEEPIDTMPSQTPMEMLDLINVVQSEGQFKGACLTTKSRNCILIFVPSETGDAKEALDSLTDVLKKHKRGGHRVFPSFKMPDNEASAKLRKNLGLKDDGVEIVLTNAKKGWWKHYTKDDFSAKSVEDWIDSVRMGEGKKEKLPKEVLVQAFSMDDLAGKPKVVRKSSTAEVVVEEKPRDEL